MRLNSRMREVALRAIPVMKFPVVTGVVKALRDAGFPKGEKK